MKSECYELSLNQNYVLDWDYSNAMRELIQNGIDQEVIDKDNKFKIEYDSDRNVVRFINTKSKLNINTLLLGASTKSNNEETVGQFGEGYKIAALVLNRIGKTFTVFNNNAKQRWDSRFKNSEKWRSKLLAFYISDIEPIEDGLVIEVGNVSYSEYEQLGEIWLDFYEDDDIEKIETSYGTILPNNPGKVYVSGLSIDYHGDLKYGYNFKPQYINLERDRKTCDSWNAKIYTTRMISEALLNGDIEPEIVTKMIEKDCDDTYQMDIFGGEKIKDILIKEFDKNNTQAFSIPVGSQEDFKRVKALGGNPVFVKNRVSKILAYETNKRIEELSSSATYTGLTLCERFKRWLAIYEDDLDEKAADELRNLIDELE